MTRLLAAIRGGSAAHQAADRRKPEPDENEGRCRGERIARIGPELCNGERRRDPSARAEASQAPDDADAKPGEDDQGERKHFCAL